MNATMESWFRKVDLHPEWFGNHPSELLRRCWRVAYRDARERAHIFCHSCDELVAMRGFGPLKKIWAKSGNVIGRVVTNDLRTFDNNTIATALGLQDYAPSRRLQL